jgi:hypothetical protein
MERFRDLVISIKLFISCSYLTLVSSSCSIFLIFCGWLIWVLAYDILFACCLLNCFYLGVCCYYYRSGEPLHLALLTRTWFLCINFVIFSKTRHFSLCCSILNIYFCQMMFLWFYCVGVIGGYLINVWFVWNLWQEEVHIISFKILKYRDICLFV